VPATEEALNRALAQAGVQADEILSIVWQPGSHMAIGDHWPKYRVIYSAAQASVLSGAHVELT
jgi:hypothetical protein